MSERGKKFIKESLTQQHFKETQDINAIMAKVRKTGRMPPPRELIYGDFSDIPDLHGVFERISRVKDAFMRLPPEVRNRFRNDPERWLKYMEDPTKKEEQYELGLRERPEVIKDEPTRVVVVDQKGSEKASEGKSEANKTTKGGSAQ
jgi:hypothetical protein